MSNQQSTLMIACADGIHERCDGSGRDSTVKCSCVCHTPMLNENTAEWADAHFVIKTDATVSGVRYCSAEADTGYRYAVTVSTLPAAGEHREGGPLLVTVVSPWIDAHALQTSGYLAERYVAEHLCDSPYREVGDADLRALTRLVRYALDRETTEGNRHE